MKGGEILNFLGIFKDGKFSIFLAICHLVTYNAGRLRDENGRS